VERGFSTVVDETEGGALRAHLGVQLRIHIWPNMTQIQSQDSGEKRVGLVIAWMA
jgi:hypothetical protein